MLSGVNEDLALPLLARRPVLTRNETPHPSVAGKTVLVTGAGGSIGSELVRQIARSTPDKLILIDQSELNLYEITCTLNEQALHVPILSFLCDVCDQDALRWVFAQHKPDIVFHAAALKHVPLLEREFNLTEAVRTNVLGTKIVVDLCASAGASFVMVSTDKAVKPSSSMGLTKRVAEIYCHGKALRHPEVNIQQVRFGNVLGSSGSVVPLFRRQIAQGGPITITHPDMTRYMMTISEAVELTLCASAMSHGSFGCFVLDMGKPVKIVDLAKQIVELAGLVPGKDIAIEFIGIRPGEKLYEELHYSWETLMPTTHSRVSRAETTYNPTPALGYIDALLFAANSRNYTAVKELLVKIVPDYVGDLSY